MDCRQDDGENSVDTFSNFHFAQAAAKILDNMGFSAATPNSLEIFTSMMRRYFDDLCIRVSAFTENGDRCVSTLSDLDLAFKAQNISISELHDYIQQVRNLPSTSTIPQYPIDHFSDVQSGTKILLADPFDDQVPTIEEVEQLHGKRPSILISNTTVDDDDDKLVQNNLAEDPVEKMEVEEPEQEEQTVLWQSSEFKSLPDFGNMNASDLGFDHDFYDQKDRKAVNLDLIHARTKKDLLLNLEQKTLKEKALNMLVERIKKHKKDKEKKRLKEKKLDREKNREKKRSKHRKKDRDQFQSEAPVLVAVDELPPAALSLEIPSTTPPTSDQPVELSRPTLVIKIKRSPTPPPDPVQPPQITQIESVEKSTPPPLLEQSAPTTIDSEVPNTNHLLVPHSNELAEAVDVLKKKKHKKEKKREKKKEKKRDKERDHHKEKSKHRKKHRGPVEAPPILTAAEATPPPQYMSTALQLPLFDEYEPVEPIRPVIVFKGLHPPSPPLVNVELPPPVQVETSTPPPPPLLTQPVPTAVPEPVDKQEAPIEGNETQIGSETKKKKPKKDKEKKRERKDKKREKERTAERPNPKNGKSEQDDEKRQERGQEESGVATTKESTSTDAIVQKEPPTMDLEMDDVWVCPICSVAYVDGADMVGCDLCDKWYHWHCVGMLKPPAENEPWFCPECVAANRKKNKIKRKK